MKITFIDCLGLPYDGSTLSKRGLGGSESAVILVSKELAKIGFDVTVFNDCDSEENVPGLYDGVTYRPIRDIVNETSFDVVVASRTVAPFTPSQVNKTFKSFVTLPNFDHIVPNSKHRILWMHDTFCDGDDLIERLLIDKRLHEVFALSDFHLDYVTNCAHGSKRMFEVMKNYMYLTRNGIGSRTDWVDIKKKDPDLFVFNSSVSKGMMPLVDKVWPAIKQRIPHAKLKIIGGYYKFKAADGPDAQQKRYFELQEYSKSMGLDIDFTGIIKQSEIAEIMAKSSFMIYPAAYPETYGISCLEALAHNTPLITCRFGALEETAVDLACYKIPYAIEPNTLFPHINHEYQINAFVEMAVQAHADRYLHQQKMYACNQVKDICGWDSVALQWKQHIFYKLGEYLPIDDYHKVSMINYRVRKVFGRRFLNLEELQEPRMPEKPITVITPVYNSEKYIKNCILSVASQDYMLYNMIVINDASTDKTLEVINETIASLPESIRSRFSVVDNTENLGAVCNQITNIRKLENDSIIMLIDGDDSLVNDPSIFHKYNNIYAAGAEFTYGSSWSSVDNIPLISQEYPEYIKQSMLYKDYKFNWNMPYTHLRTFSKTLLDAIPDYKFKDEDNKWYKAGGDNAVFYSLLEVVDPNKVVCVPDVVYNYNDANPLNDYKVNATEQTKNSEQICGISKTVDMEIL
jgi:glycosyltransferase involved in cell wall biosynthesis